MSSQSDSDASSSSSSSITTTTQSTSTKASSIPSKIPPRSCFQGIVTVEIGIEKKAFHIHKDLLTYYSDYFRGAFNGSFVEATKGKISLVDEHVDVFDVVNQFVYTRQLSDGADSAMGWELLIRVWIFGDKYLMPCLQNKAMNALIQKNRDAKFIPTLQLKIIYDNTLPGSPLRKFVLDLVTYKVSDMDASMQKNNKDNRWPYEALVDLVKALGAKKKENVGVYKLPEERKGKCYYHVHNDGERC
ncbi:hypothetical protein KCU67_g6240, partial [Aureobasidium melanogenum]